MSTSWRRQAVHAASAALALLGPGTPAAQLVIDTASALSTATGHSLIGAADFGGEEGDLAGPGCSGHP